MFEQCLLFNAKKLERQLSIIIEEEFENMNFHHTYAYIMTVIASQEFVRTKQISCELGLDSSTVTRMVAKLERDGLVRKGSYKSTVDISLTAKGLDLMPSIRQAWENYHNRCDQLLGAEGKELLNQNLIDINAKLCSQNKGV